MRERFLFQPRHRKFLKFFTLPAIACSRNNDAALLFFCPKK
ncbi:hypothetical protein ECSTECEH250_0781 [Escherichia coli STEC_EH250]|nr:hypothetical protein ECSTECEH250_0781 [Escherichia coli STEC_EH250]